MTGACDRCLRRAWLLARLAPRIEHVRHERRVLRELLALTDERLFAALDADGSAAAWFEQLEGAALRAQVAPAGLTTTCRHRAGYPDRLRELADAPRALFVAGDAALLARPAVAVVGTRRASADGLEIARGLGRGLAAAGLVVVSGMALGVDSAAHAGALEIGGATVAVLAAGADVAYPHSKRSLHRAIVEHGCVVSELPPGSRPFRWCFPARNRIIAALGAMTVVVEAAERSGSLITAEVAADLGREVGAVPGPPTAWRSRGANALLRDGAALIRDATDVLDAVLGVERPLLATPEPTAGLDARLGSLLRSVAEGRDTLAALAGAPDQVEATLTALTELELLGILRRAPGGRYVVVAQ